MGAIYAAGEIKPQDMTRAASFFRQAAEKGQADAAYNLGLMMVEGTGVEKHPAGALEFFQFAAAEGLAEAQTALAFLYANGTGVEKSDEKAATWFNEAALRGDTLAQTRLARMYFLGKGVEKDLMASYTWLSIARAQGQDDPELAALLEPEMTPELLARAEEALKDWEAATGPQ